MDSFVEYLDVSYLPSAPPSTFQTFDIYVPKDLVDASSHHPCASALVCFTHGGAWRSEDKADFSALARQLAVSTGCPIALPNYRLTPREPTPDNHLYHPAHAADLLRFLEFIRLWHEGNGGHLPRKPNMIFLMGHSCSAHMLCTLFLRRPGDAKSIYPSDELVEATAAIIMSEGIYDIDLLLASFPRYRAWFVEDVFGNRPSFEDVSAIKATVDPRGRHIRWFILHSKGDTLVDERQSEEMHDFLEERSCLLSGSFTDLEDEHNDVLKSHKYVAMIDSYVKDVLGRQST